MTRKSLIGCEIPDSMIEWQRFVSIETPPRKVLVLYIRGLLRLESSITSSVQCIDPNQQNLPDLSQPTNQLSASQIHLLQPLPCISPRPSLPLPLWRLLSLRPHWLNWSRALLLRVLLLSRQSAASPLSTRS